MLCPQFSAELPVTLRAETLSLRITDSTLTQTLALYDTMRQLQQVISVLASLLAFWAQPSLSHIPGATYMAEHCKQHHTSQGSLTQRALQVRQTGPRWTLMLNLFCSWVFFPTPYRPDSKSPKHKKIKLKLVITKFSVDVLHRRWIQWTFVDWHPKNITGKMRSSLLSPRHPLTF